MDLIKIGRYIAGKRKALGMTQRQLADKLGMSDKSVSKWERGVCLPDVSLYSELCMLLGITINEFLAGEDITEVNIIEKTDENIIGVTSDGKKRQRRSKAAISILALISLIAVSCAGYLLLRRDGPRNVIIPAARDSIEMQTAEMLSGSDGAFIFDCETSAEYTALEICVSEYAFGELINREELGLSYEDIGSPDRIKVLIVPDTDSRSVKLIIAGDGSKLSTEIPILEYAGDTVFIGRSAICLDTEVPVRFGEDMCIAALIYDSGEMRTGSLSDYEQGIVSPLNDRVYCFSLRFVK